jgi:hypothetical protein
LKGRFFYLYLFVGRFDYHHGLLQSCIFFCFFPENLWMGGGRRVWGVGKSERGRLEDDETFIAAGEDNARTGVRLFS